jgi:hypothetical protein
MKSSNFLQKAIEVGHVFVVDVVVIPTVTLYFLAQRLHVFRMHTETVESKGNQLRSVVNTVRITLPSTRD